MRPESRLHYWLRNAAVSGGAADKLATALLLVILGAMLGASFFGSP